MDSVLGNTSKGSVLGRWHVTCSTEISGTLSELELEAPIIKNPLLSVVAYTTVNLLLQDFRFYHPTSIQMLTHAQVALENLLYTVKSTDTDNPLYRYTRLLGKVVLLPEVQLQAGSAIVDSPVKG